MTRAGRADLTEQQLDAIAWGFLRSEFTGRVYANWPIDRRVDAYLRCHRIADAINCGTAFDDVLHHVMDNIGRALRTGVLSPPRA